MTKTNDEEFDLSLDFDSEESENDNSEENKTDNTQEKTETPSVNMSTLESIKNLSALKKFSFETETDNNSYTEEKEQKSYNKEQEKVVSEETKKSEKEENLDNIEETDKDNHENYKASDDDNLSEYDYNFYEGDEEPIKESHDEIDEKNHKDGEKPEEEIKKQEKEESDKSSDKEESKRTEKEEEQETKPLSDKNTSTKNISLYERIRNNKRKFEQSENKEQNKDKEETKYSIKEDTKSEKQDERENKQEEEKENNTPAEENTTSKNDNEVISSSDKEVPKVSIERGKTHIKKTDKKKPLFDKSKITKKEENEEYLEYQNKSYVDGEDGLTKEVTDRALELRKISNTKPLESVRVLNLDILVKAPPKYFNKFGDVVRDGVNYVRGKIADENLSKKISDANENQTNEKYQNDAYLSISPFISEFLRNTEYRDANAHIIRHLIVNEILGFDMLDPLWRAPVITEIVCNGPYDIQVEIAGEMMKIESIEFRDPEHLERLLERLFRGVGKVLAQATPQAKGRLHDKSRIFATHRAICPEGPNFNIRRHPEGFWTPEVMVEKGAANEEVMSFIGNLIQKGGSYIVAGGTSTGKSLSHDTPIQTPFGTTTMGEIKIGDKVFDKDGNVCNVTNKFTNKPRQVYAVKFTTGNTIYADLEHNWLVNTNRNPLWQVKTTSELIEEGICLKGDKNSDTYIFRIPKLSKSVKYENAKRIEELSIPPYLLGLWLGNENPDGDDFIGEIDDVNFYNTLTNNSFKEHSADKDNKKNDKNYKINFPSFIAELHRYGILQIEDGNFKKAIPTEYLYGNEEARRELLSGLLDSNNGCALENFAGWKFCNTNKQLIDNFVQLVSSLGYKANIKNTYVYEENRKTDKVSWDVSIFTEDTLAKLPRKITQHDETKELYPLSEDDKENISIVSIEPVNGRIEEMSCITVDSPSSTYMVGGNFTVTHNTSMLNALSGFYPPHARILTLEDNLEMKPNPKKYVAAALETRPPAPDKPNDRGVTMRDLVWGAMQMRPEVLIIGEVTDAAAYDLCQALNTGHAGASTFHANSSQLAITRVASLVAQSGLTTIEGAFDLIAAAFDFVINVRHFPQDGSRKIYSIDEVGTDIEIIDGKQTLKTTQLWRFVFEGLDEQGKIVGTWEQTADISEERRERRMFDSQPDMTWEELIELSSLPEGTKTA